MKKKVISFGQGKCLIFFTSKLFSEENLSFFFTGISQSKEIAVALFFFVELQNRRDFFVRDLEFSEGRSKFRRFNC